MEYLKIINLLDTTSDNVPRFITKTGSKFMINMVMKKIDKNQINNKI